MNVLRGEKDSNQVMQSRIVYLSLQGTKSAHLTVRGRRAVWRYSNTLIVGRMEQFL